MVPDWAEKPTSVPYANFGNPQSLNLYSYVENNPTTLGDPDGHADGAEDIEKLKPGECGNGACRKPDVSISYVFVGTENGVMLATKVSTTTTSTTKDKDGNILSTTTTEKAAFFGAEGSSAGQYLGTATTTTTAGNIFHPELYAQSVTVSQDLKGAVATFGGANVMRAQTMAAQHTYRLEFTPMSAKERWKQTGKLAAGALMALCLVGEPCGAIEAGLSLVVGAAALGEESSK